MGIESFLIASSVIGGRRPATRAAHLPLVQDVLHADQGGAPFYEESGGRPRRTSVIGGLQLLRAHRIHGPIGVYELLQMTPEIKRLIVGWATQEELRRQAEKQGMRSLRDEAISLVVQDTTTISEVIRSVYSM